MATSVGFVGTVGAMVVAGARGVELTGGLGGAGIGLGIAAEENDGVLVTFVCLGIAM